ncbi:hypothetical protein [Bacillus sp. FJAT-27251]|uniref:hypothetical protein n=1 Tax=Bacillus sp. FJAT-27251 TaxID=1684142 RepID=UPI000A9DBD37|nr:hypothetical protein [Bacillus sp. FJAT-27251]
MDKKHLENKHSKRHPNLNGDGTEAEYEISATGYGLESVEKDNSEPGQPSCGGL